MILRAERAIIGLLFNVLKNISVDLFCDCKGGFGGVRSCCFLSFRVMLIGFSQSKFEAIIIVRMQSSWILSVSAT